MDGTLPTVPGPGGSVTELPGGARLEPLGDQGVLLRFPDEASALSWAEGARLARIGGWEVVPAYRTVAVFAPLATFPLEEMVAKLSGVVPSAASRPGRLITIPCCYPLGPDLASAAEALRLTPAQLQTSHHEREYRVFAIGFVPGFPYLGWLDDAIAGLDRLPSPRTRVPAGSVGITGRQTGVYPSEVPGGWQLIGRTPCRLADLTEGDTGWFALRPGDRVRFTPIHEVDFDQLAGSRPTVAD